MPTPGMKAPAPKRCERLAINLFDLDRVHPDIRAFLLAGNLETSRDKIIRVGGDIDDTAVVFACDLLKAATCCDIIRGHDKKAGDYPTRVYISRDGKRWDKLPKLMPLTVVYQHGTETECVLNPDLFKPEWFEERGEWQASPIDLGESLV